MPSPEPHPDVAALSQEKRGRFKFRFDLGSATNPLRFEPPSRLAPRPKSRDGAATRAVPVIVTGECQSMENKKMSAKKALAALAASSLLAFAFLTPAYAQEEGMEDGTTTEMPADDESSEDGTDASGDGMMDPGMDEGTGDGSMEPPPEE